MGHAWKSKDQVGYLEKDKRTLELARNATEDRIRKSCKWVAKMLQSSCRRSQKQSKPNTKIAGDKKLFCKRLNCKALRQLQDTDEMAVRWADAPQKTLHKCNQNEKKVDLYRVFSLCGDLPSKLIAKGSKTVATESGLGGANMQIEQING
jgi:hypothetical protein